MKTTTEGVSWSVAGGRAALCLAVLAVTLVAAGPAAPVDANAAAPGSALGNVIGDMQANRQPVTLPADDAAHGGNFVEWWQWWLHLRTKSGRRFGATVTFFHAPLDPALGATGAGVRRTDFRITDPASGASPSGSRYSSQPVAIIPNGFELDGGGQRASGGNGRDKLHVEAGRYSLDVQTKARRRPAPLFSPDGFFRYDRAQTVRVYERHRMSAKGVVNVGGRRMRVVGTSWFEHGWGNMPSVVHISWDFFQLELRDGRDIQIAKVRDYPGGPVFLEEGVVTHRNGRRQYLGPGDFEIVPTGTWTRDPLCTYPSGWRLRVHQSWFRVKPDLVDQEIRSGVAPVIWDGNTSITGDSKGRGIAELLNYCQTARGP
jgi:predicted secreted hydrolase